LRLGLGRLFLNGLFFLARGQAGQHHCQQHHEYCFFHTGLLLKMRTDIVKITFSVERCQCDLPENAVFMQGIAMEILKRAAP
jgi:hypothetical protein